MLEAVVWRQRGCVGPALWRGVGQSLTDSSGEFPRWKTKELQDSNIPFNKRLRHPPCLLPDGAVLVSLLSASHGGEGEGGDPAAAAWLRQNNLVLG